VSRIGLFSAQTTYVRPELLRTKYLQRRDLSPKYEHAAGDEQNVFEYAGEGENEAAAHADQKDGSDVEEKRDCRVAEEDEGTDSSELVQRLKALCEWDHEQIDERTNGCVIVQRNERVHFESVQENLDHDETGSFELAGRLKKVFFNKKERTYCYGGSLCYETNEIEPELAMGGKRDAQ